MALLNKIRKDIKKSSYYVWFLGAQECKGLRGAEYITPVLRSLIEREKTIEPFKITLQVSHKGLKIVQSLSNLSPKKSDPKPSKNDVVKHVIPHHAVTSVYQEEDVVACVLLLYNPVTRCPVHVHAYRCDTVETAALLTLQLSTLIERPENQRKLSDIEARLRAKGLLLPTVPRVNIPKRVDSVGSDGRSTQSPASDTSAGSSQGGVDRVSHLYDSLAAELREKLGMSTDGKVVHAPILLPPRDYDTHDANDDAKPNLTGLHARRNPPLNSSGKSKPDAERKTSKGGRLGRILGSSGGSSGIGSDHPPSPDHHPRSVRTHSTSEEEWNEPPSEDSMLFAETEEKVRWKAPHIGRKRCSSPGDENPTNPVIDSPYRRSEENLLRERNETVQKSRDDTLFRNSNHWSTPNVNIPIEMFRKRNEKGNMSPVGIVAPRRRANEESRPKEQPIEESYKKRIPGYKDKKREEKEIIQAQVSHRPKGRLPDGTMKLSPQERFLDAKTKFLMLEKERLEEQEKNLQNIEKKRSSQSEAPISPELVKTRPHWGKEDTPRILHDRAGIIRRNSFFEDNHMQSQKKGEHEPRKEMRKKKISRSDSRGRYYSQESLDAPDIIDGESPHLSRESAPRRISDQTRNYDADRHMEKSRGEKSRIIDNSRYDKYDKRGEKKERESRDREERRENWERSDNMKDYRSELSREDFQRRRSKREMAYDDRRRNEPRRGHGHRDYRDGYSSPTSQSEDEDRWQERQYPEKMRNYSEERHVSPPRARVDDRERRRRYEEQDRYKSPLRRSESRGREMDDVVPFEREKNKYHAIEHEKRLNSNALAMEFKRRSYQDHMEKMDMVKSRGYVERELDERRRSSYINDEVDRKKEHSRDEIVERRSRGFSYEEEEDRRAGWRGGGGGSGGAGGGSGYQVLWERDRPPGLDRDNARVPHILPDYNDHSDEKDRFEAGGRMSHVHVDKLPARYRHSFVEQPGGGMGASLPSRGHDLLHRTNSSVSSNRVGIAAVHPY